MNNWGEHESQGGKALRGWAESSLRGDGSFKGKGNLNRNSEHLKKLLEGMTMKSNWLKKTVTL